MIGFPVPPGSPRRFLLSAKLKEINHPANYYGKNSLKKYHLPCKKSYFCKKYQSNHHFTERHEKNFCSRNPFCMQCRHIRSRQRRTFRADPATPQGKLGGNACRPRPAQCHQSDRHQHPGQERRQCRSRRRYVHRPRQQQGHHQPEVVRTMLAVHRPQRAARPYDGPPQPAEAGTVAEL